VKATRYYKVIPARLLAEYLTCRTQAWLRVHAPPIRWNADHWKPSEAPHPPEEEIRRVAEAILGPGAEIKVNPLLEAPRIGIVGRPDAIATLAPHPPLVIEYKERLPRDPAPWLVQAAAYKLAADEALGAPTLAVLATPASLHWVEARHVARALRLLRELRRVLAEPMPPPPRARPPCRSCNYRRVCPYAQA